MNITINHQVYDHEITMNSPLDPWKITRDPMAPTGPTRSWHWPTCHHHRLAAECWERSWHWGSKKKWGMKIHHWLWVKQQSILRLNVKSHSNLSISRFWCENQAIRMSYFLCLHLPKKWLHQLDLLMLITKHTMAICKKNMLSFFLLDSDHLGIYCHGFMFGDIGTTLASTWRWPAHQGPWERQRPLFRWGLSWGVLGSTPIDPSPRVVFFPMEKKSQDACLIWMLMFFVILFVIRLWILRISHPFGPLDSKAAHRNSDITQVWANGKSALRIGRLMILGCEVFRGI